MSRVFLLGLLVGSVALAWSLVLTDFSVNLADPRLTVVLIALLLVTRALRRRILHHKAEVDAERKRKADWLQKTRPPQ